MNVPLVAIVGETASGKSALAMALAERLDGEIVCADSRTVYKAMDIGTAKPTAGERARVPHYCLDLVTPEQSFSAADFKRHAGAAVEDISRRGKLPIVVGGTGLYVDALLYDFQFRQPARPEERQRLQGMSVEELQAEIVRKGIALPKNSRNPRHLTRAIETDGQVASRGELTPGTVIIGVDADRAELNQRITGRMEAMIGQGLEMEVRELQHTYGWDAPGMGSIGYREWQDYFLGTSQLAEVTRSIAKNTRNLAKRQRTWFKRNNSVHWISNSSKIETIVDLVTTKSNK